MIDATEVRWADLPDGWQHTDHRLRAAWETHTEYANRIRAHVAEGTAPASILPFADHLEARGGHPPQGPPPPDPAPVWKSLSGTDGDAHHRP